MGAVRILAAGSLVLLCACGHDSRDDCAAVACEPRFIAPAIALTVTDARGTPLTAIPTISNVVGPAGVNTSQTSCSLTSANGATCFVEVFAPGHYEFDIGAAAYATQHLKADVAPGPTGGCCPGAAYVPVTLAVALSP
jgi:hypothetical protein